MTDENMIIDSEKCPACYSKNITFFYFLGGFPLLLYPINKDSEKTISSANLECNICLDCYHIYLTSISKTLLNDIYCNLYKFYPYENLETMKEIYRIPFLKVFDFFYSSKLKKLLEIGCNSEIQMQEFLNRGLSCTAINPGGGSGKNISFVDGFYGEKKILSEFDIIISRFNLEHVVDLDCFFNALKLNIKDNGIVIIQLPNNEVDIKSGIFIPFAHEHIHYFTRKSLYKLVNRYNYEVLFLSPKTSESLICVFQKKNTMDDVRCDFYKNINNLNKLIVKLNKTKSAIILYGAGMAAAALLYSNKLTQETLNRILIVDDNELLEGRIMPLINLKIYKFKDVPINKDTIIILTLREQYHNLVFEKVCSAGCKVLAITSGGVKTVK